MKMGNDENLLKTALEVERTLAAEEAALLAEYPDWAVLRRDAEEFVALPLSQPEVPAELSAEIRAIARRHNAFRPARKRKILLPAATAAAALLGVGLVFLGLNEKQNSESVNLVATRVPPAIEIDRNLLSLGDWSALDQEAYNLSFELNSRQFAVTESLLSGEVL